MRRLLILGLSLVAGCAILLPLAFVWAQTSEGGLGGGFYRISEGGKNVFIGKGREPFDGVTSTIVPPAVIGIASDDSHILAETAHCVSVEQYDEANAHVFDGEERCFWVISKESDEVYGPLSAAEYTRVRAAERVSENLSL